MISPGPAASKHIENKAAYLVDSNPLAGQVSSYLKVPAVASFPAQSSSATRSEVSLLMPAAPKHVPIIPGTSQSSKSLPSLTRGTHRLVEWAGRDYTRARTLRGSRCEEVRTSTDGTRRKCFLRRYRRAECTDSLHREAARV